MGGSDGEATGSTFVVGRKTAGAAISGAVDGDSARALATGRAGISDTTERLPNMNQARLRPFSRDNSGLTALVDVAPARPVNIPAS